MPVKIALSGISFSQVMLVKNAFARQSFQIGQINFAAFFLPQITALDSPG